MKSEKIKTERRGSLFHWLSGFIFAIVMMQLAAGPLNLVDITTRWSKDPGEKRIREDQPDIRTNYKSLTDLLGKEVSLEELPAIHPYDNFMIEYFAYMVYKLEKVEVDLDKARRLYWGTYTTLYGNEPITKTFEEFMASELSNIVNNNGNPGFTRRDGIRELRYEFGKAQLD